MRTSGQGNEVLQGYLSLGLPRFKAKKDREYARSALQADQNLQLDAHISRSVAQFALAIAVYGSAVLSVSQIYLRTMSAYATEISLDCHNIQARSH